MIKLELVNEKTFEAVLALSLAPKDERRVAPNSYSLAQAWLYRQTEEVLPYAVLSAEKVVGFLLLHKNPASKQYLIWRLMIDHTEQNQGYGKEVIRRVIQMAQEDENCQYLLADYVIGNHRMRGILDSLGFHTEGIHQHQVVMKLDIK